MGKKGSSSGTPAAHPSGGPAPVRPGPARPVEAIVSETEAAAAAGPEIVALCERAVRATLAREEARVTEVVGEGAARPVEVSVTLLGDSAIRELNLRYLGRDSATDVLSFFMGDSDGPEAEDEAGPEAARGGARASVAAAQPFLLGDVVVSVETARRQAADYGRPFPEETARLVSHGTLHLLGYTDETEDDAAGMHAREDAVLADLGFEP